MSPKSKKKARPRRGRPVAERPFTWNPIEFRAALARSGRTFVDFFEEYVTESKAAGLEPYGVWGARVEFRGNAGRGPRTRKEVSIVAALLGCRVKDLLA